MQGSMDLMVKNWSRCRCGVISHTGPEAQPGDSWSPGCVCSPTIGQGQLELRLLLDQKRQREKQHRSPNAYSTMRVNLSEPPKHVDGIGRRDSFGVNSMSGGGRTGSRGHVMCEVRKNKKSTNARHNYVLRISP